MATIPQQLERICQQESQVILLRDLIQFAEYSGEFAQRAIGDLEAVRSKLDAARDSAIEEVKDEQVLFEATAGHLSESIGDLDALGDKAREKLETLRSLSDGRDDAKDRLDLLRSLCRGFPNFARQLAVRERGRDALLVDDEYDLQYLFLALLRLHFEDVRPEEPTSSLGGGGSRMDFLLKKEKIVVETKRTRDSLLDRRVAEELLVDIPRYAEHNDCKTLVCFVYDPDSLLDNPRGLEVDLSRRTENLHVEVIVSSAGL